MVTALIGVLCFKEQAADVGSEGFVSAAQHTGCRGVRGASELEARVRVKPGQVVHAAQSPVDTGHLLETA